jgi:uncharacterized protein YgfB (UPF0149 family)
VPDENGGGQMAALTADLYKWKQRARDLKAENERLQAQVTQVTQERDQAYEDNNVLVDELEDVEGQLNADPDGLRAKIEELEGDLWGTKTRSTFDKLAKKAGVREDALDDLWKLLGVQRDPENELTEDALGKRVAEAVKARAFLLQSAPEAGSGAAGAATSRQAGPGAIAPRAPGPGAGRGAPDRASAASTAEEATASRFAATGRTDPFRIA